MSSSYANHLRDIFARRGRIMDAQTPALLAIDMQACFIAASIHPVSIEFQTCVGVMSAMVVDDFIVCMFLDGDVVRASKATPERLLSLSLQGDGQIAREICAGLELAPPV